jgi:hypothetical protein
MMTVRRSLKRWVYLQPRPDRRRLELSLRFPDIP